MFAIVPCLVVVPCLFVARCARRWRPHTRRQTQCATPQRRTSVIHASTTTRSEAAPHAFCALIAQTRAWERMPLSWAASLSAQDQSYCSTNGWKQEVRCTVGAASNATSEAGGYITFQSCPVVPGDFMDVVKFEVRTLSIASSCCIVPIRALHLGTVCHDHPFCDLLLLCDQAQAPKPAHPAEPHCKLHEHMTSLASFEWRDSASAASGNAHPLP